MNNWKTKNGYQIVQVLSGRSNVYLVVIDRQLILIDTGKESTFRKLKNNINSLGLSFNNITYLILTHTHFDHCQLARKVKENSSCKIIVSGYAENWIKKGYTVLPRGTTFLTKLISRLGGLLGERHFGYQPFEPDILIRGNYDLNNPVNRIKIIETPGHSEDSISVIVDNEVAIVGDVMFGVFKKSISPPYADNIDKMIRSWKRLLNTDCDVFLPGHGNEIKRELLKKRYDKNARKNNNV